MISTQNTVCKRWLAVTSIAGCFITGSAWADIMVRVEESFNGQLPTTALHWFGSERSARDDGNLYVVTRLDEGKTYTIDRMTQSYQVSPLPTPTSSTTGNDVRAIKHQETRKIGQWNTEKYEIIGSATAGMNIVIWASKDVKIDLPTFQKVMTGLSRRPGSEWMAAYREIDGFPVLQEVRLQHKGTNYLGQTRVVTVEERDPPPHIYSPPDNFQKMP